MVNIPFRAGLELEVRQSLFLLQVGFYCDVQVSDQVQDSMVKSGIPLKLSPNQTAMQWIFSVQKNTFCTWNF